MAVKEKILNAAQIAGKSIDNLTLIAVTKTVGTKEIQTLIDLGLKCFGENRVQVAEPKINAINDGDVQWHLIGNLQTNKVKKAVSLFSVIHSVDSIKLATEINKRAKELDKRIEILIEVNVSGEINKSGINPEALSVILEGCKSLDNIFVSGLMTMAPQVDDPEQVRSVFRALRQLADQHNLTECSMGMSDDFEVAVEEGATMIRIGRALFE